MLAFVATACRISARTGRVTEQKKRMIQSSRFAWITDDSLARPEAEWDREILRTERFVALPSVGALVPGWTLVVPRRPLRNLSDASFEERTELGEIANTIAHALQRAGEQVFCFEHGSRYAGSLTGCGVDQAHLHIVPLTFDLIQAALRHDDGAIIWHQPKISTAPLDTLPQQGEYVALWRNADHLTLIGKVRFPISQWVRRVIADELGIGSEWNYRTHPQSLNVRSTLAILAELRTAVAP
jgi:diadenosine tetraphosphate (Ap4A) HIT family hydrolase